MGGWGLSSTTSTSGSAGPKGADGNSIYVDDYGSGGPIIGSATAYERYYINTHDYSLLNVPFNTTSISNVGNVRGVDGDTAHWIVQAGQPDDTLDGNNGDMYIDSDNGDLYGAKTGGSWGASILNLKGIAGNNGTNGTNGVDGAKGETGDAATISVGTTTTGGVGTNASVVNTGDSSAAVLEFTIPKGDAGNDGEDGEDGLDGVDGKDGKSIETTTGGQPNFSDGDVGDTVLDGDSGTFFTKIEVPHVESITVTGASYTADDSSLNPDGLYLFDGYDIYNKAKYRLDRQDGDPTPDYIIIWDEGEQEWELKSNTSAMPPPLSQCSISRHGFYPSQEGWFVNAVNYPVSTLGIYINTFGSITDGKVTWTQILTTLNSTPSNESPKTPTVVDDDTLQITLNSSNTNNNYFVYVIESTDIIVGASASLADDYEGTYVKEATELNGKPHWKNSNNKYISWNGGDWCFRDTASETAVCAHSIATSGTDDPSLLTETDTGGIDIYPDALWLTDFSTGATSSTKPSSPLTVPNQSITLDLDGFVDATNYPEIIIQKVDKEDGIVTIVKEEVSNVYNTWNEVTNITNNQGNSAQNLSDFSLGDASTRQGGSIITWSLDIGKWVTANNYTTSWSQHAGIPIQQVGLNGDFHLDSTANKIYQKRDGTWTVVSDIGVGAAGNGVKLVEETSDFRLKITLDDDTIFTSSVLKGDAGSNGSAGGVPVGGTTKQILSKSTNADYATEWIDIEPVAYNTFIRTGIAPNVAVPLSSHGKTYILDRTGTNGPITILLPYNPSDGWQCYFINRNNGYVVDFKAIDSAGNTNTLIPDAGWAIQGDVGSRPFLRDRGDGCSATWDSLNATWYITGKLYSFTELL